jgi:hypothetical protein
MRYVSSRVDRSDVNHLLPGRIRKTSPGEAEKTQHNQDQTQGFFHGASVGSLLLKHLFNLADFLLDLASESLILAFRLEVEIVCDQPNFLLTAVFYSV